MGSGDEGKYDSAVTSRAERPASALERNGPLARVTEWSYRQTVGGREYLGCVGVLAVLSLMGGVGVAAVAGTVLSLFLGPILLVVIGAVVLIVLSVRGRRDDIDRS